MRVGLVCPYSLDVPGGVQNHVQDLAEALLGLGHDVAVLAPTERRDLPPHVTSAGRAVAVPYNGAVARMSFGPVVAARTRRWLADGNFDVLHLHEPATPSLSLLALWASECPVVATYHSAHQHSRALSATAAILRPSLEKIGARVAVSEDSRLFQVSHVGGEPVVVPNGLYVDRFATAPVRPQWRGATGTVAFVGRFDEPRKGFGLLADAFGRVLEQRPGARLLVVGGGDVARARAALPHAAREAVDFLGPAPDADKASALRTADVFVAPHTGAESFGIVLAEAMAAGATVLAADLPAFRRVLDDGRLGALFPVGRTDGLAGALALLLSDEGLRRQYDERAAVAVRRYDWSVVAARIVQVYETVAAAGP